MAIDKGLGVNRNWGLLANFDDCGCAIVLPPMPPFKLCQNFADATGPHKIMNDLGEPKGLDERAEQLFVEWGRTEQARLSGTKASDIAARSVQQHNQARAKAAMDRARVAAKQALEDRQRNLAITLAK